MQLFPTGRDRVLPALGTPYILVECFSQKGQPHSDGCSVGRPAPRPAAHRRRCSVCSLCPAGAAPGSIQRAVTPSGLVCAGAVPGAEVL